MGAGPQTPRAVAQPVGAPAHLIIRRNPNLGSNVIVRLWIDNVPARSIGYGHTYEAPLAPGHHVLAVLASPNPRWPVPWQLAVDVQSGRTYSSGWPVRVPAACSVINRGNFRLGPTIGLCSTLPNNKT